MTSPLTAPSSAGRTATFAAAAYRPTHGLRDQEVGLPSGGIQALFNHNDKVRQGEALAALGLNVVKGNPQSLDLLFDVARRHTHAGRKAESFLAGLFEHPLPGSEHLAAQVAQRAAELRAFPLPHGETDKLNPEFPEAGRLFYMAGSCESPASQEELSRQLDLGLGHEKNIWQPDRPITPSELDADRKQAVLGERFHAATSLEAHTPTRQHDWQFTPLLVGEQWVLAAERHCKGKLSEAVVFSPEPLDKQKCNKLRGKWGEVQFTQCTLQQPMNHASGVFVRAARLDLAQDIAAHKDPIASLKTTAKALAHMSPADCQATNRNCRHQMLGALLDNRALTAPSAETFRAFYRNDHSCAHADAIVDVAKLFTERQSPQALDMLINMSQTDTPAGQKIASFLSDLRTNPVPGREHLAKLVEQRIAQFPSTAQAIGGKDKPTADAPGSKLPHLSGPTITAHQPLQPAAGDDGVDDFDEIDGDARPPVGAPASELAKSTSASQQAAFRFSFGPPMATESGSKSPLYQSKLKPMDTAYGSTKVTLPPKNSSYSSILQQMGLAQQIKRAEKG